jgi:ABC-type glycerol-3-phosphate transport system substrate-binding protein
VPFALVLMVMAGGLAGCTGSPQRSDAQQVAVDFVTAIEDQHGADACALLTSDAEASVSGETAVLNVDENGAGVRHVQVWGDAAQVKVGSDTVFLQDLSDGWRVRAAGCRFQPGAAYNCDVKG